MSAIVLHIPAIAKLTSEQQEKFLPLCPDFVIEISSNVNIIITWS
jgi:Uma2 family endonuclease